MTTIEKPDAFTPGPWAVRITADFLQVVDPSLDCVCEFGLAPAPDWEKGLAREVSANARLTAAAPELFNALAESLLQIQYLHEKFGETGSGNAVLASGNALLSRVRAGT